MQHLLVGLGITCISHTPSKKPHFPALMLEPSLPAIPLLEPPASSLALFPFTLPSCPPFPVHTHTITTASPPLVTRVLLPGPKLSETLAHPFTPHTFCPTRIANPRFFSRLSLGCGLITVSLFSFFPDPFEIQGIAGCSLHSGGGTVSFLRGALGGVDFLSVKNYSCVPAPEGGSRAQRVCALIHQYAGIRDIAGKLLFETCPQYLLGVLDVGKAELQREG